MNKAKAQVWMNKLHNLTDMVNGLRQYIHDSEEELKIAKEQARRLEKQFWKYKQEWSEYLVKEAEELQDNTQRSENG